MRLKLISLTMFLGLCNSSAQSTSPLNAAELAALLGNFGALTVTAPKGSQVAVLEATSQLGSEQEADEGQYSGSHRLSIYDFRTPIRLIVGLAGDPISRSPRAPALSLPGIEPCGPEQQLAILGASTNSETNIAKQCLGMGDRAEGVGGGGEPLVFDTPLKLNTWTPVFRWYFTPAGETYEASSKTASADPKAQIVWWAYFSDDKKFDYDKLPKRPMYQPGQ